MNYTSSDVEIVTTEVSVSYSNLPSRPPKFFIRNDNYNAFVDEIKRLKEKGYKEILEPNYVNLQNVIYLTATLVKPD